jgi:hypothetical protein
MSMLKLWSEKTSQSDLNRKGTLNEEFHAFQNSWTTVCDGEWFICCSNGVHRQVRLLSKGPKMLNLRAQRFQST